MYTCKCIFIAEIPLRLTQCFPLIMEEGQVCIHLTGNRTRSTDGLRNNFEKDMS